METLFLLGCFFLALVIFFVVKFWFSRCEYLKKLKIQEQEENKKQKEAEAERKRVASTVQNFLTVTETQFVNMFNEIVNEVSSEFENLGDYGFTERFETMGLEVYVNDMQKRKLARRLWEIYGISLPMDMRNQTNTPRDMLDCLMCIQQYLKTPTARELYPLFGEKYMTNITLN